MTTTTKPEVVKYEFTDLLNDQEVHNPEEKNKILVLSFFNTWCGPCIKELPHLEKLKNKYTNQNVKIVLVCAGEMDSEKKLYVFIKSTIWIYGMTKILIFISLITLKEFRQL